MTDTLNPRPAPGFDDHDPSDIYGRFAHRLEIAAAAGGAVMDIAAIVDAAHGISPEPTTADLGPAPVHNPPYPNGHEYHTDVPYVPGNATAHTDNGPAGVPMRVS